MGEWSLLSLAPPWDLSKGRGRIVQMRGKEVSDRARHSNECNLNPGIQESLPAIRKKKRLSPWLGLLIFTLCLRIICILNSELDLHDTVRVAGIAREMAFTGNYFIPRLNGQDFLEYPSLGYLPIALFLSTSRNPSDFLATLPVAFLGTVTVLLTFLIGKVLTDERVGLTAGFILATMFGFFTLHQHCLVDPTLLFFITLSLYGFITAYQVPAKRSRFFAIFYLAMAGGFLSKGLVGVAIPGGTALIFLIVRRDFTTIRKLYFGWGILLFLLPIALWMVGVWWIEGPVLIKEVIRQSLWRFLSSRADHAGPAYSYFIPALLNTLPWTPLLFVWLWYRRRRPRSEETRSQDLLALFALVWFLTVFVGLSMATAKRTVYLAPLYPPFALLSALGLNFLREKFPRIKLFETYGLIILFLGYIGIHFIVLLPSEKEDSLRPVFEVVRSQRGQDPVYLYGASESLRGAAVFYLGKTVPVRERKDLLQEGFETPKGMILVVPCLRGSEPPLAHLRAKGFVLLTEKNFVKASLQVYSNSP